MIIKNSVFGILVLMALSVFQADSAHAQTGATKSVMLILGSANPEVTQHRIEVAAKLYHSTVEFDRIIVSGGCGAHDSSICEASRMDSLLRLNGIPAEKIFKEEKSKSTKQNLCYSRKLKNNGIPLIKESDHLYVVSDHWHAIPVAACFREAAGVKNSAFHVEGTIEPRGPADYTNIFSGCTETNYCKSILWPNVDAAYFDAKRNKIYYFVDDVYFRETPGEGVDAGYPKNLKQYPGWPEKWDYSLDAAFYNPKNDKVYLFSGTEFADHVPGESVKESDVKAVARHFGFWPDSWGRGYVDAAYYDRIQDKVYFFKGSEYYASALNESVSGEPKRIADSYLIDWPFQWGTGDIDAAFPNPAQSKTVLFRGTESLQFTREKEISEGFPKKISLPWPEDLWGERP